MGDTLQLQANRFHQLIRQRWVLSCCTLLLLFVIQPIEAQTLSLSKAKLLERQARHVLFLVSQTKDLSDDLQISQYVTELAQNLSHNADLEHDPLRYYVIEDSRVNAFAAPGATFFINSGIIEIAQNEGELASVIAHELAHFKQDHLSRLFDNYRTTRIPTLLSALVGLAVGGEEGAALMWGSVAAQAEAMIEYTLAYEREADAIGLKILTASDYQPVHAVNFMKRMAKSIRDQGLYESNIHNTHPITRERIASFEARINRIPTSTNEQFSDDFHFLKARVLVLYDWVPNLTARSFQDKRNTSVTAQQIANRYGYALALAKDGELEAARAEFAELLQLEPNNQWLILGAAEIELNHQNPKLALKILEKIDLAGRTG